MAILVINSEDFSKKLTGFELKCKECGSNNVTLDIDWASYPSSSWMSVIVSCNECKKDEEIYSVE